MNRALIFLELMVLMNLDLDYIDFPTGWAIQKAYPDLDHDLHCSANPEHPSGLGGPALLCDCPALAQKWHELRDALAQGRT